MYSSAYTPPRRGHRKRLSALRLSSDSTVTTLPVYTSPPRHRLPDLPDIPAEQPPAYSDSAEEADEDTDESDSDNLFVVPSPPPSLPVSPRPSAATRRSRTSASSSSFSSSSRGHRRNHSLANLNANDPYLDSLLARSVHALEMSNALLQSSMSTQTSLSAVLADDADADRSLERRAQALTSRIRSNRDLHDSWLQDLDSISRGVEGLVRGEDDDADGLNDREEAHSRLLPSDAISQSLPTGGLSERIQRRQGRRASQDFRQASSSSGASLQLSTHDRSAFVAPAPRAITMYVDSSEAADAIALPSTLGIRPTSRPPPTPLPSQSPFPAGGASEPEPPPQTTAAEEPSRSRVVDMLASFVMPRTSAASTSNSASSVSSSPSSSSVLRRRDSSSSSKTVKRHRPSKSPPPTLQIDTPSLSASTSSASGGSLRSRSLTPSRGSPVVRQQRPLTPPIEELSTSSTSSDSHTLHVDRTVESLRQILERQQQRAAASSKASSTTAPALPRPALLSPPAVAPTSGTSNATASVSRLFTKARHTTSTRPPSPPRHSSMKGRSAPSTPVTPATPAIPAAPSPSPSLLNVPDVFGSMFGGARSRPPSSGASTPKRISFAEPLEPYSSSRGGNGGGASGSTGAGPSAFARFRFRASGGGDEGGMSKARGRSSSTARARRKGKGKARARSTDGGEQSASEEEKAGWWAGWLLGTSTGSGSGSGGRSRSEERYGSGTGAGVRSVPGMGAGFGVGSGAWAMRPGFGSSLEEWGA
ncbi:hypothetical protein C8Q70DRAFT_691481 [Cubamyces menziesii]|nr:hypothetical protein C8Q70DRAFT_691481 [Cubamyces menziesii]